MVIADLGAGEGTFSQLLAQRAKKVIAVDNSEKMVEFGAELARKHGFRIWNTARAIWKTCRLRDASVDLAFFSQALHHAQHPERAVAEAWRILKPGGRIVVLDLVRHNYEEAREMYADLWLGFTEVEALAVSAPGRIQEHRDVGGASGRGSAALRDAVGDSGEVRRQVTRLRLRGLRLRLR